MGKVHDDLEDDPCKRPVGIYCRCQHAPGCEGKRPLRDTRRDATYKWLSAIAILFIFGALAAVRLSLQKERALSTDLVTMYSPGAPLPSSVLSTRDMLQMRAFSWTLFFQGLMGLAFSVGGSIIVNEIYAAVISGGRLALGGILAVVGVIGFAWTGRPDLQHELFGVNFADYLDSKGRLPPLRLSGSASDWSVHAVGSNVTTLFKKEDGLIKVAAYAHNTNTVSKRHDGSSSESDSEGDVAYVQAWAGNTARGYYFDTNENDWDSQAGNIDEAIRDEYIDGNFVYESCVVPLDSQGNPVFSGVLTFNDDDGGNKLSECQDAAYARFPNFQPNK